VQETAGTLKYKGFGGFCNAGAKWTFKSAVRRMQSGAEVCLRCR
jgi:hypothetical protein